MTSQEAFDALCNWVNVAITRDSAESGLFLTDDSLEYLDLSHLSITLNGLKKKQQKIC